MRLSKSIVDNVNIVSGLLEKGTDLLGADANLLKCLCCWLFGRVLRKHVFRSVNVLAEMEVVYFFSVSTVAVTASNQFEHFVTGWHDVEVLHDTEELLRSNVHALRAVEVLEAGLQ